MKISNAARLIFWVTAIMAVGFLVRAESGEKRTSMPGRKSAPPLRIIDQNGQPAVSGAPSGWSAGPYLPSVGTRLVGVYFPANGKFYGMGGRSSDAAGSDFTHPFEYDPDSNSWATKSATYPDNQVNNMACSVIAESGTPYIYCVGGS